MNRNEILTAVGVWLYGLAMLTAIGWTGVKATIEFVEAVSG